MRRGPTLSCATGKACAVGGDCSECHAQAGTDFVAWEADTPNKRMARKMSAMVLAITNRASRRLARAGRDHDRQSSSVRVGGDPRADAWPGGPTESWPAVR